MNKIRKKNLFYTLTQDVEAHKGYSPLLLSRDVARCRFLQVLVLVRSQQFFKRGFSKRNGKNLRG